LLDEQRHAGRAALLNGGLRPMDLAWLAVRDTTDRLWTIPIRGVVLCAERRRPGVDRPTVTRTTPVIGARNIDRKPLREILYPQA
jgi:hypothetical protein